MAKENITFGQRAADWITSVLGSWRFIILQSIFIMFWITFQLTTHAWDKYPYILLNLMLSFQAAYSAPIIMMSQNRQAEKDRKTLVKDLTLNVESMEDLYRIEQKIDELLVRGEDHSI